MTGRRHVLTMVGAATAALMLTGCLGPNDGDSYAERLAEQKAEELNETLGHRTRIRDAEHIAATEIAFGQPEDPAPDSLDAIRLIPVRWSGRTFASELATVDVQIVVTVSAHEPSSVGDLGMTAGEATLCFRYVLQLYRYTEYDDIDCPASTEAFPKPRAASIPQVPDDAPKRLTRALRTATAGTLDDAVRGAFPQDHLHIETAVDNGTLVAAVGVPAERDCLLMVKRPDGTIDSPGYDRIWLEPGELGCSTDLYTSPPG